MLPDDVLDFLRTAIGSVWALELLVLLHRDRARRWRVEELIHELRGSTGIVTGVLAQFAALHLVEEEAGGLWRFAPTTPELDALVERVVASYAKFPFAVIQAIVTAPAPADKLQLFADAFRIKKKE